MRIEIYLQKIGNINDTILKELKKKLEKSLKNFILTIKILPNIIDLSETNYVDKRSQYNGSLILEQLKRRNKKNNFSSTLGILDVDIFKNNLNFLFGCARKPKFPFRDSPGTALLSITRLRETYYGRRRKKARLIKRILKEALHELGHTFGLEHCKYKCVMQFSESLRYVEEKPPNFCEHCLKKLNLLFNVNET